MRRPEQDIGDAPYIRDAERNGMPEGEPEMIKCACGCDTTFYKRDTVFCEVCHRYFGYTCAVENPAEGYWLCWDCIDKAVDALADVVLFNKGWKAAQKGEPVDDRADCELQGWQIFMWDEHEEEVKRLRKRDCNATVVLCYDDGCNPFARETLNIVDVGISDNIYVVESEVVKAQAAEVERLREVIKIDVAVFDVLKSEYHPTADLQAIIVHRDERVKQTLQRGGE